MLRIRKLADVRTPANRAAVAEVQAILGAQFPGMPVADIERLPEQLEDPLRFRFRAELFVAEDRGEHVRAFALLLHASDLGFCMLDTISVAPGGSGGGLGATLYERVREETVALGARGLYFECLRDDPTSSPDPAIRKENRARLRFYERYGARPIVGTAYETPLTEGDTDAPYLVFDGLDRFELPNAKELRRIVDAILVRKYASVCPPGYIDTVVASIDDGAYGLREPIARASAGGRAHAPVLGPADSVQIIVNADHEIHHVRERGYVEAPVRVAAIERELAKNPAFERVEARHFPQRWIREVHDGRLVDFIERTCRETPARKPVYPYVFPIRNPERRPADRSILAGYWCIDTFTPLDANVWPAAVGAVDCALTAADLILQGRRTAYALVRPPGHHAERRVFGGFCYFNNAAIAANYLSHYGSVAVLDIDYHHGNGTQDIFYERSDVLTVSVHGHPSFAYPYFAGFRDERGRGPGAGYNLNIPLPESITPERHRAAIGEALRRIDRHRPAYLVLAVGFDTAAGDPTGTWQNRVDDFKQMGSMIGASGYPILVVQEGGYRVRTLGTNARAFFSGLLEHRAAKIDRPGSRVVPGRKSALAVGGGETEWRDSVSAADVDAIRQLAAGASVFSSEEVGIAAELVAARVSQGLESGYEFILAAQHERLLGYACYGPVAGTDGRFDLYWIVVAPEARGRGLARELLKRAESSVAARGGRRLYVETSTTEPYAPARRLYRRAGYRKAALLEDFYRDGDGKLVLVKLIEAGTG